MSQSSDDTDDSDEDNESESDTDMLTPNGIKLNAMTPEPVYANMALMTNDERPTTTVRHIRVVNWPDDENFPADFSTMITLYSEVGECLKKNPGGRVLVHCL
jgi:protein tyrosine phosphatase